MKYIDLTITYFKVIQPGKYWSGWFNTFIEVTKPFFIDLVVIVLSQLLCTFYRNHLTMFQL